MMESDEAKQPLGVIGIMNRERPLPQSLLGKAIAYTLNLQDMLSVYLEDGRLEMGHERGVARITGRVLSSKSQKQAYEKLDNML